EIEEIFTNIKNELSNIAGEDGTISTSEQGLLDTILMELNKYRDMLNQALQDNKLDQQEKIRLFSAKLDIIRKAVGKIKKDMIVSDDEQAIMNGLQQLLPKIIEYEDKFSDS
ncbi:MAG: hypothetical protein ACW99A_14785, partial [Candidatus Kariarchaeaceae archaeon]